MAWFSPSLLFCPAVLTLIAFRALASDPVIGFIRLLFFHQ